MWVSVELYLLRSVCPKPHVTEQGIHLLQGEYTQLSPLGHASTAHKDISVNNKASCKYLLDNEVE